MKPIQKPQNTPYFSDTDAFDPTKIITDKGHNVYMLLAGNVNGLVEYENRGEFFWLFWWKHHPKYMG